VDKFFVAIGSEFEIGIKNKKSPARRGLYSIS
jgi:hypothetical protein